jgi:structural maintenance of chromosome 1
LLARVTFIIQGPESVSETEKVLKEVETKLKQHVLNDRKASGELKRIRDMRATRFMAAFGDVQRAVDLIYTDMTKSSKHPLGGSAYLSLSDDNDEEPFNSKVTFSVKPANKRYLELNQLSGGERTIACLSLLFAINKWKAAPLLVMDEVDAALDNGTLLWFHAVSNQICPPLIISYFYDSFYCSQLAQAVQLCEGTFEVQLPMSCH